MKNKFINKVIEYCWYGLIAFLPITSMPAISKLFGSDSVASPSILFLIGLSICWLLPAFFKNEFFHQSILPLAFFFIIALLASVISFFYDIPMFKGINQCTSFISAISTLVIGFLFFVIASSFPHHKKERTFQIINWSGLIVFLWCTIQAVSWYSMNRYPRWMFELQGVFSERVLYRQRVTGFALEPSWLSHQLNMFYIPFWLSFTLHKKSNHSFRIKSFTFENILLGLGIIFLFLTLSRVGYVAFIFMLIIVGIEIHQRIVFYFSQRWKNTEKISKKTISTLLVIIYIIGIVIIAILFSKVDPRMGTLFNFSFEDDNPIVSYVRELKFGDRVIYWWTGWRIFTDYPILGVGLGNAGYFFPKAIPPEGWQMIEVRRLMNRTGILLNIKSFWIRLLAETGLVGFSFFIGWLIYLSYCFTMKIQSKEIDRKVMGYTGFLILLGMVFEGLSIDSFAMPYWWLSLGLAVSSN